MSGKSYKLINPKYFVEGAEIVEESIGYGFWLYIKNDCNYTEYVRCMDNFRGVFKTQRAAKLGFSQLAYPGSKWTEIK